MEATNAALVQWFHGLNAEKFNHDWREETFRFVRSEGVPVKEGAEETLLALKAEGYLLGLCTNNIQVVVQEYLKLLGWENLFDVIVTAHMVKNRKPNPDTYLKAAELLHVKSCECVGVEDSPSGLYAVHAAGMHCVRIPDLIDTSSVPGDVIDQTLTFLKELPGYIHALDT